MRRLRPNSRGMIVEQKPQIITNGTLHAYARPSTVLKRVDGLMSGETPRILITRTQGGIGDVLMTTPLVRAISKKYNCKVDYATDFGYLDGALQKVLVDNPYINQIIPWREADHEQYHAVVDLTCPCVYHEKPHAEPINRIDLFARHVGMKLETHHIDYQIRADELDWAKNWMMDHDVDRYKTILLNPFSSTTRRDAPVDKVHDALAKVMAHGRNTYKGIVVTHGSDTVKSNWNYTNIVTLHNHDVRHIAAIMNYCNLVICPDSALLHLASALHKKTLTLFGPTDPRARVNYHKEAVAIWPGKELRNYPCWYEDPRDGYLCWKRLETDLIAQVAISLLEDKPLPISRDLVTFGNYLQDNQYYHVL